MASFRSLILVLLAFATPVLSLKEGEVARIRFEVRKFLREVVEPGLYGPDVTVKFVPGKPPTMLFFDANDEEVESKLIQDYTFADLTAMVQSLGFRLGAVDNEAKDEV